jgi:hypothetical protein
LTAAADRGDPDAVEALWRVWLREPDDELWEALARWRGPGPLAEAVFAAAADPVKDAAVRAALGAFCARHGLAPGDITDRAVFFVLTGQAGQHRAADPDGSLLTAAYRAAGPGTRAGLREAIAASGDLDLVRVVTADRPGRFAEVTGDERQYLIRQLADRGEWDRLWRLVPDVPLAEAVRAVRRFGAGWRPPARSRWPRRHTTIATHTLTGSLARPRPAGRCFRTVGLCGSRRTANSR